jgi:AcrR family transcriptional regulator
MAAPRRARRPLYDAVLDLAAHRPVEEITATEVALAAGVHRSTFYEHATSPAELLRRALREQLDDIRTQHLTAPPAHAGDAVVAVTLAVLAHVEDHGAIYERALLSTGGGDLRAMLAEHFRDSMRTLEATGVVRPPFHAPGASVRFHEESTARFIANGVIGILEAWLSEDPPREPAPFLAALEGLATALHLGS